MAYAQEHAREWVPPLVTVESAERLLRNYATDPATRRLVNSLDIFIVPSVNTDGGHYSFYDENFQRKNMFNYCPENGPSDPAARDDWGVDNNRNYPVGSLFDGFFGASTDCTIGDYAGPFELSEPESRNVLSLPEEYPNIRFSMNLHSSGNYFMWSPGAYTVPGRVTLPRPTLGEESYFWGASTRILTAIKRHRGLSVTPGADRPDRRRPLFGGRELGRRPLVRVRHLRLELRDRHRVPARLGGGARRGDGVLERPRRADERRPRLLSRPA